MEERKHAPSKKPEWKRDDGKVDYRKPPRASQAWPDFGQRIDQLETNMWWKCAYDYAINLDYSACPAAWVFVIKTSDFWRYRNTYDNPAAKYVTQTPDFMRMLSCGYYDKLFEYYDLGPFEYRKKHPRKADWLRPRRSSIEGDIMEIWSIATSLKGKALPLSSAEGPEDVAAILRRAKRDLKIKPLVKAYVNGMSVDFIAKAVKYGAEEDTFAVLKAAYDAGVSEDDIFPVFN